jgi:hypothetical protein
LKNIILRRVSIFEFLHSQGQSRRFGRRPITSGLPLETDIVRAGEHISKCADIAARVFLGGQTKFLEPLMRFASGDANSGNERILGTFCVSAN